MIPTVDFSTGYHAIRHSVALEQEDDIQCLMLGGKDAFNVLNAVCPCDAYLQNGQLRHTFLLNEQGVPFADVYVGRDWENAFLLGYCPKSQVLIDWIRSYSGDFTQYELIDLMQEYSAVTINGPYAWELCAEVAGSFILGLPYLALTSNKKVFVFRAGVTGEFGYHFLIPTKEMDRWLNIFLDKGEPFKLAVNNKSARAQCTLENFFFDINREGKCNLNPMELQLQWRISLQKENYPGYKAINRIRTNGWTRRLCAFRSTESILENCEIFHEDKKIGSVLAIGYSPSRKEYIGKALLEKPYWWPGLDCFMADKKELTTISAPTIDNLSLNVNPYLNSYFTKDMIEE